MAILEAVTTTGASTAMKSKHVRSVQATGLTTAGVGAATINVEVSNDKVNWLVAFTISLTLGTSVTTDGQELDARWEWIRANVTAISGTGASVTVTGGDGSTT